MAQAAELAAQHPDVPFVLDHVGCPYRRDDAGYDDWLASMKVRPVLPPSVVRGWTVRSDPRLLSPFLNLLPGCSPNIS